MFRKNSLNLINGIIRFSKLIKLSKENTLVDFLGFYLKV